ncbi:MAG: hypothetical protein Q4D04_12545 [Clostridia bacterium]|nr:hypothetical protein [Clostridia bacterium]
MAAKTMEEIAEIMKGMRFRRCVIGGVREDDVWRAIERLQKEYRSLMESEREKAQALIDERDEWISTLRAKLRAERNRHMAEDYDG